LLASARAVACAGIDRSDDAAGNRNSVFVRPLAIHVAYANVTAVGVDDVADVVGAHFERELDLQPIELGEEIRASMGGG